MTHGSHENPARQSGRATWRPFVGQVLEVAGGAFEPEIREYRENTGEVVERTLENLLRWAASKGVVVPDFMRVVPFPPDVLLTHQGRRVPAKYFSYRPPSPEDKIYWSKVDNPLASVCSPEFSAVIVNMDATVLDRDEEFLHVLAHEVYEVSRLKEYL